MLFEVLYRGEVKFCTDHKECIPSKPELRRMQEAGYALKMNGKPYQP